MWVVSQQHCVCLLNYYVVCVFCFSVMCHKASQSCSSKCRVCAWCAVEEVWLIVFSLLDASKSVYCSVLNFLHDQKLNLEATNKLGWTPPDCMRRRQPQRRRIPAQLCQNECMFSGAPNTLTIACSRGHFHVVKLLLLKNE